MQILPRQTSYSNYSSAISCGQGQQIKSVIKKPSDFYPKINTKSPLKKTRNLLLVLCSLIVGMNQCTPKKISGDTLVNSEPITYININPNNRDIIINTISNFRENLTASNDFLKDVKISIVDKIENADTTINYSDYFKENCGKNTKGASLYSDGALSKQILIQEKAHNEDKLINLIKTGHYSNEHTIKQTVMHEVGHQFDSYFGHKHDAKFAQKWDSLQAKYITASKRDVKNKESLKTEILYYMNNGLSDKQAFQDAVLKDLQHIAQLKRTDEKKLARNIRYYTTGIDLSEEITPKTVDYADLCRSEIYANLFSYAIGENNGDKERFTENFSNSYEIVKADITKNLGKNFVKQ